MSFTRTQQQEAYKQLPEKVQSLVLSNETADTVRGQLKGLELTDSNLEMADSEILYAMFGLQTIDNAIENIAKISGKALGELVSMKSELQTKIFDKIKGLMPEAEGVPSDLPMVVESLQEQLGGKADLLQDIEHPQPTPERPTEVKVSAELKLEPPKAGGSLTSLAPVNAPVTTSDKPKNLIDEKLKQVVATPIKTSVYPGGLDPYREPTQ